MDPVRRQYETYPYPERDPADEARRLVAGSPSDPVEIDHFLFGGRRDWSQPFRALVAGGGTGDGLVMLAQRLAGIGCPAEVTYLDMSEAARAVAEARIAARGLGNVRFVTGDLLAAPELGAFDYIDCCGVLHHLADPDAGFAALAAALAPGGGMGLMVYAPHGRTGVYPLQSALAALLGGDEPVEQVRLAREALGALPETNWFRRNDLVGDHEVSDAGLYDLLLHGRDRPCTIAGFCAALERAGLGLVSMLQPARYDPLRYLPRGAAFRERAARLDPVARMQLAEDLAGNIKTHVAYVARAGEAPMARPSSAAARPHLSGASAGDLARLVAKSGAVAVTLDRVRLEAPVPREAAGLIGLVDGRRDLGAIAAAAGLDWVAFSGRWAAADRAFRGFNLLHYSRGARR